MTHIKIDLKDFVNQLSMRECEELAVLCKRRKSFIGATWLSLEEGQHVQRGDRIVAIRMVRARTGLGLMDAKAAVDAYYAEWMLSR